MEKLTAFFLVLAQLIFSEAAEYDYSYSRYNSYSDYDCNKPLLLTAHLKATSSLRDRGPENAKLHCKSAWTAADSTMNNNLAINLDGRHEVRVIETRGRSATNEFVEEYIVQYSDDGETWRSYTTSSGEVKMFKGNSDGDHIRRNEFEVPIIAQWVRINPTRWRDRISLRVELYGCDYVADTLAFNGSSMVKWDLLREPLTALRESIRFRFKTSHASGVLLYSRGSQGDLIALQLWENRLLFNIDLGSGTPTSLWAGSLLDDNVWHDVVVSRNRRDVLLSVDRVVVRMRVRGEFSRLDLNRAMYVGGVPYKQEGLIVLQNFTGCMENLYLNSSNILWEIKEAYEQGEAFRYQKVNTMYTCPEPPVVPVTFLTRGSYARLKGYEGTSSMNVSFHFRTFEETGLLLHHDFTSGGWVRLFLEDGKVKVELIGGTGTEVKKSAEDNNGLAPQRPIMDNYDEEFNDGRWHAVMLAISTNSMILSIDRRPVKTTKQIKILTGPHYLIAGGKSGHLSPGFIGCMRLISIDGNYRLASDWKPDEFCCEGEVVMDACHMTDRCNPNPCEHGGVCRQSSLEFICHCQGTGYAGAVCHTPTRALSCTAQQLAAPSARSVQTNIDVDGSGPLAPFPVTCTFLSDGRIVTSVEHSNTGTTGVDGFQEAGSFRQDITYDADRAQLEALLDRSTFCRQRLSYSCRASRLLNSPSTEADFRPFAWWISRGGRRMDYWAGALPGSRKCQCGLNGSCRDPTKWCNCDSGTLEWDEDGGDLTEKEFLPVRQLRFGDTGTPLDEKEGRYTLGPLECEGDDLFSNVITFRVTDATILLPTFDMGHSGDIYFEFKTTVDNAVILHSKGPQDYIKISIVGGHQLQFQYQAGSGPLGVTVETSYRLADNLWHSVSVERNRKEARLVLDGALRGSVREPAGPVRALRLGGGLMIGATVDFRDGFVGCIRALLLNGIAVDLLWHARRGLYGVGEGCNGRCDSQPCMNNGTCLEGYDGYSCDCRWTSFKGPICADEIGVHLRPSSIIKYDFMGSWRSTIAEKIRVGFTTTNPKGFLLGFSSNISGEYLTIMVSNSGHLRVVFDFGFERQELIFPNKHFGMGQYHDVRLSRKNSGATLVLQIDNYEAQEYDFNIKDSADAQFNNIQYMYIGRNESMHEGFIGCISRVEFDDIYPLKLLFQEKGPANVKSLGSPLTEDFCGVEPVTHPPIPVETRPPPIVDEDQLRKDYHDTDQAILGGVLLVVFILLVIAAAVVVRALARHSGEYLTREESGAAAADTADDAALAAATGPRVTKRREWFI